LDRIGYVKKGRRRDKIKDELLKQFRSLGMSDKKTAEAFRILELEGAGDAVDRICRRRRRRGQPGKQTEASAQPQNQLVGNRAAFRS
jgi:hypothetical protein